MQRYKPTRAITFDCYGTLIDWETGLWKAARPVLQNAGIRATRKKFLSVWEPIQFAMIQGRYRRYRTILQDSLREAIRAIGGDCSAEDAAAFASSMGTWKPFPDVTAALARLENLYVLAPISNTDDEFLRASARLMGDPFHHLFTAQQARAYKPSTRPFEMALEKLRLEPSEIVHVAFGFRYDLGPARKLGIRTAWLNRGIESLPDGFSADFELTGMDQLVMLGTKAC